MNRPSPLKASGVADDHPQHRDHEQAPEVHHEHVEHVLRTDHAAVEERQSRRHEQHERAADQQPRDISRIHPNGLLWYAPGISRRRTPAIDRRNVSTDCFRSVSGASRSCYSATMCSFAARQPGGTAAEVQMRLRRSPPDSHLPDLLAEVGPATRRESVDVVGVHTHLERIAPSRLHTGRSEHGRRPSLSPPKYGERGRGLSGDIVTEKFGQLRHEGASANRFRPGRRQHRGRPARVPPVAARPNDGPTPRPIDPPRPQAPPRSFASPPRPPRRTRAPTDSFRPDRRPRSLRIRWSVRALPVRVAVADA